jgi:hypothetical protein
MIQQFLRATCEPASLRRVVYIVCGPPLGAVGFVCVLLLVPAAGLSITVLGLALVAAIVLTARRVAALHRWTTRRLLGVPDE